MELGEAEGWDGEGQGEDRREVHDGKSEWKGYVLVCVQVWMLC